MRCSMSVAWHAECLKACVALQCHVLPLLRTILSHFHLASAKLSAGVRFREGKGEKSQFWRELSEGFTILEEDFKTLDTDKSGVLRPEIPVSELNRSLWRDSLLLMVRMIRTYVHFFLPTLQRPNPNFQRLFPPLIFLTCAYCRHHRHQRAHLHRPHRLVKLHSVRHLQPSGGCFQHCRH